MRGMNLKSRSLAWLLSLALILTLMPVAAFAEENMPGARSEYNASTGDVFLGGNYIEVGISKHGSFGTSTLPQSDQNWHPHSSARGLGLTSDGDGWDVGDLPLTGDFFLPGSPEERWGLAYKIGGNTYQYFVADRCDVFYGTWKTEPTVEDVSTPETGLLKAVVTGETIHGIEIIITYSFGKDDKYYKTSVEVKNKGDSDVTDVRFIRSFDPDQDQQTKSTFNTYNKVICNPVSTKSGNAENYAMVVARGEKTLAGFFFLAFDNRARASRGVAFSPSDIYTAGFWDSAPATSLTCAEDASVALTKEMIDSGNNNGYAMEDNAIALTFNLGTLAVSAADSMEYMSSLDPDVEACLAAILSLTLDYKNEVLTGIEEAAATYTIKEKDNGSNIWTLTVSQDDNNAYIYSLKKGDDEVSTGLLSDGIKIPEEWYGKTIIFQQDAEGSEPAEIEVSGRPETPGTPTTLPDDADKPVNVPKEIEITEVTTDSVTIAPVEGQEYAYSTNGTDWTPVPSDNIITGLDGFSEVKIKTRIAATSSAPASAYSDPLTVALKTMIKNLEGFSAIGYTGDYDGEPHSITVTVPEGASVAYSNTSGLDYKETNPAYINAGTYTVYYRVTQDGYYPVYGSETVKINKVVYARPAAPEVSNFTVTINEADREKKLKYAVVTKGSDEPTSYVSVPVLDSNGSFDLTGLTESTDYTIYLRQKASADGNYKESPSVSKNFKTPASYSVAYNANYGTGTVPASVTRNKGESVTVASGDGIKRTGYTFTNWNTQANGGGTPYYTGDTINTGATLYAQWQANNYTVKYDANGGTGSMENQSFDYDRVKALTENSFSRDNYQFTGWATSANGPVVYSDKQSVKNLASDGTVTLYAVWTQDVYTLIVEIESGTSGGVDLKLVRGNQEYAKQDSVSLSYVSGIYKGEHSFNYVPNGTYNAVVKQGEKTVTQMVIISGSDETISVKMPSGNTNSVLDVKEDTRPVVVGGLDSEAQTYEETGKSITVTMTVEKKEEQQLPETADQKEQQTQEAIAEIKTEASGKTLEFMNIEVAQTVGNEDPTPISQTNMVMEIVIPYDMTGKNNITVYRYHGGNAEALTQMDNREKGADGTFCLDRANSLIYVYAQKFSTYAIGYTVPTSGGSGGSGTVSYPVTVPDSSVTGGKISISQKSAAKGSKVTISVEPEDGYQLDKLIVKDKNGNSIAVTPAGDGKYTFEMPSSGVTVEAAFREVFSWNTDYAGCLRKDACPILPYTDTAATRWFHDGIHFCLENGLMVGCGENQFRPDDPTTRSMITVILWRLNGSPVVNYAMDFADVGDETWYAEAVRWAQSEGLAGGYGNGTFGSADTLTREQMVTMLYRYASYKGYDVSIGEDTNILSYSDALEVSEYAVPAMQWACGAGVLTGKEADNGMLLDSKGSITRAEMATLMMRFSLLYE